ncbi:MAG: MerR family transcriptional regulator [Ardenticatenaceae bacterium]|nr:MerR family transcriptional regulator [Ardenticatenaceae bacterium]HBY95520.1 MerR family transcriptional regulator [Chloroflexota bacterium]
MAEPDLEAYSDVPIFNTKAVVRETGVPAATLRAWERRYGIPEPDRTASNYRLYSERDIALIRWLRERVESGLTISQAIELFRHISRGEEPLSVVPGEHRRTVELEQPLEWGSLAQRLLDAFLAFDEQRAELVVGEAFAIYPVEDVITHLIQPVMVEVGERWQRDELPIPVEHFATAFLVRKVMSLINTQPVNIDAPLVIAGCAPSEHHELGILLFTLFLRRQGLRLLYLGQNVPLIDLQDALETLQPAMLALSAATLEAAGQLVPVGEMVAALPEPRPLFAFGGQAFERHAGIVARIPGLYIEGAAPEAARQTLLHIRHRATRP